MRKTKIICTLGPAVDNEEALRALIAGGMNAARFNFSHGDHASHLRTLESLRRAQEGFVQPIATILDTKGPEIRIRSFSTPSITLAEGDSFTLTAEDIVGDTSRVSITYPLLHERLEPGCHILIDDGLIDLVVARVAAPEILCTVREGGELSANKSINIPSVSIPLPSLTEKDRADIRFGVEQGFDFVAASFVRSVADIEDMRAALREFGGEHIHIIAKIENREGVDNIDEIIRAADGIMVARGDLGVEIPPYEIPALQKSIIAKTLAQGKPVITATQMLESMIRNPVPTRAEISDIANAVFDGTSCVMLSGETASGKHPIQSLSIMARTVEYADEFADSWERFEKTYSDTEMSVENAISHSCCLTAMDLRARAILAATASGSTARRISRFRPACPIVALTLTERACRQLALSWGVYPYISKVMESTDELFDSCVSQGMQEGFVDAGDVVVITAGVPIGQSGTTNIIKAQIAGE